MALNKKQKKCSEAMFKLLERCHKAGLTGGVFDGCFCLWPKNEEHPAEAGNMFFEKVEEIGEVIHTQMVIDGGAGV